MKWRMNGQIGREKAKNYKKYVIMVMYIRENNPWGAYDLLSDVYYLKPGSDNNVTMTGGSVRCVSIR